MPPFAIVFGPGTMPLGENGCCASAMRSVPAGAVSRCGGAGDASSSAAAMVIGLGVFTTADGNIRAPPMRTHSSLSIRVAIALIAFAVSAPAALAQRLDPIVYTVRVPAPDTHYAQVEALVPTSGRASIEMMMPVWSPG